MRQLRSALESLDDEMRVNVREGALTRAQQGLRPMVQFADLPDGIGGAPNTRPYGHGRAGHDNQSSAPGGTGNGRGLGTSSHDGVELMAGAINNRVSGMERMRVSESRAHTPYTPKRKAA